MILPRAGGHLLHDAASDPQEADAVQVRWHREVAGVSQREHQPSRRDHGHADDHDPALEGELHRPRAERQQLPQQCQGADGAVDGEEGVVEVNAVSSALASFPVGHTHSQLLLQMIYH